MMSKMNKTLTFKRRMTSMSISYTGTMKSRAYITPHLMILSLTSQSNSMEKSSHFNQPQMTLLAFMCMPFTTTGLMDQHFPSNR